VRRRWRIAIAAVLAALVPAAAALGDADPASDVLVAASVFYPYSTPVSSQLQKALSAEVAAASRAHLPLKVALITAPFDLGGLPALFGKPQQYARFLDQELTFNGKPPLLVVMPAGYGVAGMSAAGAQAATSLAQPAGKTSDDLARAAITAVPRLAAASGHPIASGSTPGGSSSGGGTGVAIGIVAAVAVATAAAIIALRRRRTRPR
jgi:hypothetical protein